MLSPTPKGGVKKFSEASQFTDSWFKLTLSYAANASVLARSTSSSFQSIGGETLHGLARRHDVSRNLIRIWVSKLEAGAFDEDVEAAGLLQEYEAKISALERLVGRQALEIEFPKGALKSAPRPRSATTSVIAGPVGSPSREDVV